MIGIPVLTTAAATLQYGTRTHFFSFWYHNALMDRESSEKRIVDCAADNIDRIGVYRIVRRLGAGGMGTVYEVVHTKLGVHYALKTFTLDHGRVKLLKERFLAEGRILARLHHPNLVRVFDLDIDAATGTPYFVMDMVQYKDGYSYTLADLEPGGADEERLAAWFVQLCSALDYVHGEGIVHRDIKLGNILLNTQGGVVLSDFGVSRFCNSKLRQELRLDNTMVSAVTGKLVMGTSGYMAPEVKRGEDATAASDAYSLGIVFFRLLTGVWYENRPNIWGLLEPFNEAWCDVLRKLLAEKPEDRPIPLGCVAQKVAESCGVETAPSPMAIPSAHTAQAAPSHMPERRSLVRIIGTAAAILLIATGGFLVVRHFSGTESLCLDDLYSVPVCLGDK